MSSAAVEQDARPVAAPPTQDRYRLLLLRKNGSELLVANERPPFTLPCAEIPRWERVAETLTAAVRKHYGISAICLFEPSPTATESGPQFYQVMETRQANVGTPDGTNWLPLDSISDQFFTHQDQAAIAETLRRIDEFKSGIVFGPFGKPGWVDELFAWTQREIEPYGFRLTGECRQLNASPTFALLRLETDRQAVWFKAVGEPNLRELPISLTLSKFFPGFVPTVVATNIPWHGWLATEFSSLTLDEVPDSSAWERAARTLAELQIASLGKTPELLAAECRDIRTARLLVLVDPFLEAMSQLMDRQEKTPPVILGSKELQELGTQIKDALSAWSRLKCPDSLGHMDFNPGNILCSPDQCVFLDWAEGYVGPPFLTLQYLREHLARLRKEGTRPGANIAKAYVANWGGILSRETVERAMDLSPVLAVFAYAAGTTAWRTAAVLEEPRTAAWLRSLTRRIHVEMQLLLGRRLLCRN